MNLDGTNPQPLISCTNVGFGDELNNATKLIYPNPSNDIIHLDYGGPVTVQIYDLNGKCVLNTHEKKINVRDLNSGVYSIILKDDRNEIVGREKFVKTK